MKKLSLYTLLSMLCMFMTSCNEDFEDWADPQSWPQEEAVTIPGFTASATGTTINLKDVTTDSVQVLQFNNSANAEIANVRLAITPADAPEAAPVMFAADTNGKIVVAELAKLVDDVYGKRPVERTFNAVVYANAMVEGQAMFINAGTINIVAVPVAPVIRDSYYLVGNICDWNTDNAIKFDHSGKDVYEDPVFSLVFDVTDAELGTYWKILTKENADDPWFGQIGVAVDGDTSMSGKLVFEDAQAGHIEGAGKYLMTLNMMDGTYEIKPMVSEFYYLVGALQGWNGDAATGMTCAFFPNSQTEMSYTTKWEGDGNFKFWTAGNFGNWDNALGSSEDMSRAMTGTIVTTGAGAVAVPEQEMFYTIKVNMASMTYEWVKLDDQAPKAYDTIGLIGGFNGWGADEVMKQTAPHNWFAEISLAEDTELKFRANADWADNWGVADGTDTASGCFVGEYNKGNIKVVAGDYRVYFNDITSEMMFVKK